MKIVSKAKYKVEPHYDPIKDYTSYVDKSGYIPMENHLEQMKLAGVNLQYDRYKNYSHDLQSLKEYFGDLSKIDFTQIKAYPRNIDKLQAMSLLKDLQKQQTTRQAELDKLRNQIKEKQNKLAYAKEFYQHFKNNPQSFEKFRQEIETQRTQEKKE